MYRARVTVKTVEVAVLLMCSPKHVSRLAKTFSTFYEVIEVHSLTGSYDILLIASELTLNDMEEKAFIKHKLRRIFEIEKLAK